MLRFRSSRSRIMSRWSASLNPSLKFPPSLRQRPTPFANSSGSIYHHRHRYHQLSMSHNYNPMTLSKCFSSSPEDNATPFNPPSAQPHHPTLVVVSFYKFADFLDHAAFRTPLKDICHQLVPRILNLVPNSFLPSSLYVVSHFVLSASSTTKLLILHFQRVSGGIILAPEGINGSICGTRESVGRVLGFIQSDPRLKGLRQVESPVSPEDEAIHHGHSSSSPLAAGEDAPFRWDHVRVKLKKEIVTLGMPAVSPIKRVGKYVKPNDWNALIRDPDTVVIDVRNNYETRIGKFKGAMDPCTTAFREFPTWVEDQFKLAEAEVPCSDRSTDKESESQNEKMPKRVAMYCTGGIRCEKASSLLLRKGFKEVYHLEGGILKYLEEVPKSESLWEGECFVFDKRVSVDHGLAQGTFKLCYGCKQPVSDADMEALEWEYGVCCPHCFSSRTEEEKDRARARQRQFETWWIIGGPDKGRRPLLTSKGDTDTDGYCSS